jgi:very-short-patch-repair endonuclease
MKNANVHTKKALRDIRKELRNKSTSAEIAFWNLVKNRKIEGRKFRRQHSIDNFIVDFYCPSAKLIIELDGDYHGEYFRISEDLKRDEYLEKLGYMVLRFENRFIFKDPEFIIKEVVKKLNNHPGPEVIND